MSQPTQITSDTSATRKTQIAMGVALLIGLGLVGAGVAFDWGFLGFFWAGVLVLGSGAGLVGTLLGGGFFKAPCPSCGEELSFTNPKDHRIEQCEACKAWSQGVDTMALVEDDYVATYPAFKSLVNLEDLRWPRNEADHLACPVCGGDATLEKIEAVDVSAGAALGVGGTVTTVTFKVPMCEAHKEGLALFPEDDEKDRTYLGFKSRSYQLKYEALNPQP